ncbi:MAG: helix-hairpin-helix domain-containing protein [Nitrospirales bacterium]|nr:helix-hairpin-helix domain-containing protein [Nitrospirales bacterium]
MSMHRQAIGYLVVALVLSMSILFPTSWGIAANPKVDLNSATLEQLESVNGIGHDTAEQILAHKKAHGAFHSMDELLKVKGVGKVRLKALAEAFTVSDQSIRPEDVSQK